MKRIKINNQFDGLKNKDNKKNKLIEIIFSLQFIGLILIFINIGLFISLSTKFHLQNLPVIIISTINIFLGGIINLEFYFK